MVLAAGGGSRFAGDAHKLVADFRGEPLVAWAIEAALGAGLGEVVVVSGAVDLDEVVRGVVARRPGGAGITLLVNRNWRRGQATSLRLALERCERQAYRAAVVGLGDQPLVPASAWRAVATADHAPVVVATYGGRRRNPVRLHRSVWSMLPSAGDEGARVLMRQRPDLVGEVACEGDPADIDTLEDLRRWAGGAGAGGTSEWS